MEELKNSKKADAMGNCYRAAFSLAKGNIVDARNYFYKSSIYIPEKSRKELESGFNQKNLMSTKSKRLIYAEKLLDAYILLKRKLTSLPNAHR